jgi:soluble lytic murein transglycosylase
MTDPLLTNNLRRSKSALAFLSVMTLLLLMPVPQQVAADPVDPAERYRDQRQLFLDGRDELSAGDITAAAERVPDLAGYPLQSYYEYLILRRRVLNSDAPLALLSSVKSFKEKYSDQRAYRRLLGAMKNRLADKDDWSGYLRVAATEGAPVHRCDDLYAAVFTGEQQQFNQQAADLWHSIQYHTPRCDKAFALLIERAGDVPTVALWKRTVALIRRGALDSVDELLPFYGTRDRAIVQSWLDNLDDPEALLALESANGNMMHHQQLVQHVLGRWLAADLPAATSYWRANGQAFGFGDGELQQAVARHAVLAAKRSLPEAATLLQQSSAADAQVRYWRIRNALRLEQWELVLERLNGLTDAEQQSTRWLYWRARALEQLGNTAEAVEVYRGIADEFEYYGFMAADQLDETYQLPSVEWSPDEGALKALADNHEIVSAIEYFLVDIGWEGRRVWNAALEGADKVKLIAAAALAQSVGWYDRSYASIRQAGSSALVYQYPRPYRPLVDSLVENRSVDASMVYAVMRRESAYIPDVKSPAGAIGLMQLMPATAKEMAGRTSFTGSRWSLIDGEVNINLGVEYLELVLNRFEGNAALAAAAYNAGPSRVDRWRDQFALPTDVWVETIPFDETRNYVKAVLFSTVVFDTIRGGEPRRLRTMMGSGSVCAEMRC